MKKIRLGTSDLHTGEISLGCMRMDKLSSQDAANVIENAVEHGVDLFDHADIYGGGKSEEVFANALKETSINREDIVLQTKCGIRGGFFDFSKQHILDSVDGSLQRLNTDYIDILLLHRPDALMEPEEVKEAFVKLKESGKVRHFGVSNQNPMQIELLKKYLQDDLIINQLQLSLMFTPMIDAGLNVNMQHDPAVVRDSSILDYSRLNEMTIQAWSPFQFGMFEGVFVGNDKFPELNAKLQELAEKKGVTDSAIAIAWILRHPANIQPVVGTMNMQRLSAIAKASDIELTREEWYELYRAAGNQLP
ncbi:aldo/keto reductase family oxidoreductase [Sediminibacillus dalangtanensis]|uniref:Aldo/keto reductase family oxidoreductase n=1 Tax=Sediminibacillus dalangtanensis TaxID=2729421 RepID=A0ABX7VVW2_9BACI|nr:aldo/keto reductase [Sediminibacillus dalangtanensis]QTN00674.1 aldo/keto reductase family oxidoreductase [Sediminibacillus dalangtanensis]